MAITLKLGELVAAKPAIEKLLAREFPMTTSFRLARRLRVITEELTTYEKKNNEMVVKLGHPIPGQPGRTGIGPTYVDPETKEMKPEPNWDEYVKQSQDLLGMEITVQIDPIPVSELCVIRKPYACPKCGEKSVEEEEPVVSINDMILLGPIVTESAQTSAPISPSAPASAS